MKTSYVTCKVISHQNGGYGLELYLPDGERRIINDVTYDENKISELSSTINRCRVSSLHVDDVIEDLID